MSIHIIQTIRKNRGMKKHSSKKTSSRKRFIPIGFVLIMLLSCANIDPGKVNIEFERTRPEPKITSYTEALVELGMMSEIYATDVLKIQNIPIFDNTGSSVSTGGEIPKDISEMVKSVLNSIGGNLVYIPYDPSFMQNLMVTGYSNFQYKMIPDVVISGGITEFDRGLETREKNTDVSSRLTYEGLPDYLPGLEDEVPYPSKEMEFRYEHGQHDRSAEGGEPEGIGNKHFCPGVRQEGKNQKSPGKTCRHKTPGRAQHDPVNRKAADFALLESVGG
jgi:hypothetical protein